MSRFSLVLLVGLLSACPSLAASWAEATFTDLSKDFGSVPRGPTLKHAFWLKNNTNGPVTIAGIRVSCGCVTAAALQNTLKPGEETAVVAHMDTSRFSGPRAVTIFVQFSQPQWDEVRLVVQANSRDDISVGPESLAFGQVKHGTTPSAAVTVTLLGNSQAQITEARSESNYVQASLKETKRSATEVVYQVTASLRPDVPAGKWYTDVWLKTNNPTMPQLRVPLTVEIATALSLSPDSVSWGEVAKGAEVERKVIVRGVQPFRITAVEGADENLSVTDSIKDSKEVHVLTVKLKGGKPGEVKRTLRIVTDLKEEGEIDLPAQGKILP
jgi:hypothetical protein